MSSYFGFTHTPNQPRDDISFDLNFNVVVQSREGEEEKKKPTHILAEKNFHSPTGNSGKNFSVN